MLFADRGAEWFVNLSFHRDDYQPVITTGDCEDIGLGGSIAAG
jgi:hypothetical protein